MRIESQGKNVGEITIFCLKKPILAEGLQTARAVVGGGFRPDPSTAGAWALCSFKHLGQTFPADRLPVMSGRQLEGSHFPHFTFPQIWQR
jgi:hypothetical protein